MKMKMYNPKKKDSFVMMFGFEYPIRVIPRTKRNWSK